MRTTLTIDADVAVQLKRLQRSRDVSLKQLVNDALRRGLRDMAAPPQKGKPFRTQTFNAGRPLIDNIDNVAEVLAVVEGDAYK
jgi:hypothetical protein